MATANYKIEVRLTWRSRLWIAIGREGFYWIPERMFDRWIVFIAKRAVDAAEIGW